MTENDNKQPHTVGRQLASGVFYTSIAKYAGIVVTLVVSGVLARLFTPEEFGVVNIATVVIAFFAIFSDLGIGPAVIQHKNLDKRDLGGIFSLTLWSGAVMALLFFAASGLIASFYDDSAELRNILRILSANLFFAAANIVPNGLILKEKRFRFAAVRSLSVQVVGGAAAIAAAYAGAGIYALTINPVFSSLMLFVINYRQNPLSVHLKPGKAAVGKVFSFSAYQFSFQLLNYFSRNLDKLLMGRYMSLSQLGYYDKSYRLMMLPLQNIAYVVSPVMHPIFSEMQNDLRKLADSYRKVVRLLALIGLPLSVVLWFTAQELVLIIFGDQWQPSVPVFRILALSVGIQIVMSTSGSIFQAANATRMLFFCGLFSAALNTMQPSSHTADATQNRNVTIAASRDSATITGAARILRTIIAATSIKKSGWFVLLPILYRRENRHTRMSSFHHLGTKCPEVVKAGERRKAAPRQVIGSPPPTAFSAARTAAPKGRHSPFGALRSPRDRCRRYWHGRPLGLGCWHTAAAKLPAPGCPRGQHGEHSR